MAEKTLALGLGCDRGTPPETLAAAIEQALAQAGASWAHVLALASIDLKADEPAMQQLMAERGVPIRFYTAAELARVEVPNPSELVRKYTGTPSVSEAAALLVAGETLQRRAGMDTGSGVFSAVSTSALLVEKHKLRGTDGRNATVSVAVLPDAVMSNRVLQGGRR
ncbi:MAG: cobalamin biosynthesis protein [Lautropia sp.]|nr:cobalamin biosynthesis protein [Lautropia sp.]